MPKEYCLIDLQTNSAAASSLHKYVTIDTIIPLDAAAAIYSTDHTLSRLCCWPIVTVMNV